MPRLSTIATAVLALALVGPDLVSAEATADAEATIALSEAIARAVDHNKELAAFEHRLREQRGRVEQSGLLPNPLLKLEVEGFAGTDDFAGFDSAQSSLSLEWVLERTIRRRRVAAAEARSSLLVSEAEILRLDVAGETAERFLMSLTNQARYETASEAVSLAEGAITAVKRRVRSGKAPTAELTRAEAELAEARLSRDDVEHELAIARHRLAAQWGEVKPSFVRVRGDLLSVVNPAPFEAIEKRLDHNPRMMRLFSKERVARAELELAEARRRPTLRPSVGLRHINATDDIAAIAEINVPLALFDRNEGRIAESQAALAHIRADTEAARVRVRTTLFGAHEELKHNVHRAETLRDEVIPRLARALEETSRAYQRGRYSYLEWRLAQSALLDARIQLIEASAGAHRLVVVLERLTGVQVGAS